MQFRKANDIGEISNRCRIIVEQNISNDKSSALVCKIL